MPGWHVHPNSSRQNSQQVPVQHASFPRGGRRGRGGFRGARAGYEQHQVYQHGRVKTVQMRSKERDLSTVYGYSGSNQRLNNMPSVS